MRTISAGTRQELVAAVTERYQQSTAAEKRLILDEFVALTGYHRKHAVRVLNGTAASPRARRGRPCVYDSAVTEGLIVLWEASDRMCGKRLKALLPTLVPALEQHGHLSLDPGVRERLLAVSAATIDRRLASARAVTAGQRRRRRAALNGLRSRVPVRTFGDWGDPAPGFVEVDLVAHCGGTLSGSFVWTLALTDIASGWTECVPLLVREARLVVDALDQLRGALPFALRGIDTDNGSEFLVGEQRGVGSHPPVGQLAQPRQALVPGVVDLEVLALSFRVALAAEAESPEEDVDATLRRPLGQDQAVASQAAPLIHQPGRGRPLRVVEHARVQRPQHALEQILPAHDLGPKP